MCCCALSGLKKALDPLELTLQTLIQPLVEQQPPLTTEPFFQPKPNDSGINYLLLVASTHLM